MKTSKLKLQLKLQLKHKLILLLGGLIMVTICVQSVLSYLSLSKAYNTAGTEMQGHYDTLIKTEVESLVSTLQANYNMGQSGKITPAQALENAKSIVRDTRYNNGDGYFWADTADGVCAVHMNSEYEGKNRLNDKDLKGTFYIQNILAAGKNPSGGFTSYYFTKPGADGAFLKRAYTMEFEPYGWFISTGNYQVDIDAMTAQFEQEKQIALLKAILSSFFVFAVGIFLMVRMSGAITKPLTTITERLLLLSEGDLHTPVPVINTKDETEVLAQATARTVNILHGVINDITTQLGQMSDGDFRHEINMDYVGDIQPIKDSIHKISHSLSNTLLQASRSAEQVDAGSTEVSNGAQVLAQGTAEQASAVEVLSASANEISEQIRLNAEHAAMASSISHDAVTQVNQGKNRMQQMTSAMVDISNSSKQIERIIHTIDDIAFQTNILALNAAVEAARAGSAGKGFAVVADEVRNLATKSAEAASTTAQLIEHSIKTVESGSAIADETAQSLLSIVQSTERSAELIRRISQATNQQASSIGQITQGVEQISSVIQTNSATAQESAAASEELSSHAHMMNDLIRQFKLKETTAMDQITEEIQRPEIPVAAEEKY